MQTSIDDSLSSTKHRETGNKENLHINIVKDTENQKSLSDCEDNHLFLQQVSLTTKSAKSNITPKNEDINQFKRSATNEYNTYAKEKETCHERANMAGYDSSMYTNTSRDKLEEI